MAFPASLLQVFWGRRTAVKRGQQVYQRYKEKEEKKKKHKASSTKDEGSLPSPQFPEKDRTRPGHYRDARLLISFSNIYTRSFSTSGKLIFPKCSGLHLMKWWTDQRMFFKSCNVNVRGKKEVSWRDKYVYLHPHGSICVSHMCF